MTKKNPLQTQWGQAFDIKAFAYCPTCQAMPGSNCKTTDGKIRKASHQARQHVYQRALKEMAKVHAPAPKREASEMHDKPKSDTLTKAGIIAIVGCDKCGVDAGTHCRNPNGSKRKRSHHQRLTAAQAKHNSKPSKTWGRKPQKVRNEIDNDVDDSGWFDVIE